MSIINLSPIPGIYLPASIDAFPLHSSYISRKHIQMACFSVSLKYNNVIDYHPLKMIFFGKRKIRRLQYEYKNKSSN